MCIYLCVVYGYFHALMAHCNRLYDPQKLKYLASGPLHKKYTDHNVENVCI